MDTTDTLRTFLFSLVELSESINYKYLNLGRAFHELQVHPKWLYFSKSLLLTPTLFGFQTQSQCIVAGEVPSRTPSNSWTWADVWEFSSMLMLSAQREYQIPKGSAPQDWPPYPPFQKPVTSLRLLPMLLTHHLQTEGSHQPPPPAWLIC